VAHLTFPVDYQEKEVNGNFSEHKRESTNNTFLVPTVCPQEEDLERAASILNAGNRVVILAGRGARNAGEELVALADKLGAPIVKALLGKQVVPDDSPFTTGGLGLLGTKPSTEAMEKCDTILLVGTSFPYVEFLPKPEQARGIQIDDKPDRIGLRYPVEIGLVGDAKTALMRLVDLVKEKTDRNFLKEAQKGMEEWRQLLDAQAPADVTPIKPQLVAKILSELIDDDAIISGDSGTNTTWIARYLNIKQGQQYSCSGTLASMASGLPYAIAAKIAFPLRQSVAFVGDGGFTMLMGEFVQAVKYNLPITVVVIKNEVLGQIKWEQIAFLGNPQYGVELQSIDFAKFAEACGGIGYRVTKPDELKTAIQSALASGRPAVVEVLVDPNEPPMPPKVTVNQAVHFAEALAKGQPERKGLVQTLIQNKIRELV
jgi:pyruvate dehydrogenase (quinone)/pyruvate oxidase